MNNSSKNIILKALNEVEDAIVINTSSLSDTPIDILFFYRGKCVPIVFGDKRSLIKLKENGWSSIKLKNYLIDLECVGFEATMPSIMIGLKTHFKRVYGSEHNPIRELLK